MGSVELVETIAPELTGDPRIQSFLDIAFQLHTAGPFGAAFSIAMANYAAHLMTRAGPPQTSPGTGAGTGDSTAGGPITSKKAGDLAVGFGASAAARSAVADNVDSALAETKYGRDYLAIRDSRSVAGPGVVTIFP